MKKFFILMAYVAMALTSLTLASCSNEENDPIPSPDATTTFTISYSIMGGDLQTPIAFMEGFEKFVQEKLGKVATVGTSMISTRDPETTKSILSTITPEDLKRIAGQVNPSIHDLEITIREGSSVILTIVYQKYNNDPTLHTGTYTYPKEGKDIVFTLTSTPTGKEGYYASTLSIPEGLEGIDAGTYAGGSHKFGSSYVEFVTDKVNEEGKHYLKFVMDIADSDKNAYQGYISLYGKIWSAWETLTKK